MDDRQLAGQTPFLSGKVRDLYEIGPDKLLLVASDRISAFDHVLGSTIPNKGKVLTQLSLFWFDFLKDLVPNHLISSDVAALPPTFQPYADQLRGRSMVVQRARMLPVECVARGYLSGSGWKDYQQTSAVCGIPLPAGLRESDRLPQPIFTPAAKNHIGHDENISFERVMEMIGGSLALRLKTLTLAIYTAAAAHAKAKGLLLADTKFEFGFIPVGNDDELLVLADEVLTPDSSRYWLKSGYAPGGPQPSFDKQYVRDYLEAIHWDKQPPAPTLPAGVVAETQSKYLQAFTLLTGKDALPA